MMPPKMGGTVKEIKSGSFTVEDVVAVIETDKGRDEGAHDAPEVARARGTALHEEIPARHAAPVRPAHRGYLLPGRQGRHGSHSGTVRQRQDRHAARACQWADVDLVVYIGCGERGNEMTDVLREFPELVDPRTGESLMKRTVLIANTSDMPVAAREASIYTGITIAEYFRDMGYAVAVIADSTLPLGGGAARNVGPFGRDARRRGLPRLPFLAFGAVLRARGRGRVSRQRRAAGSLTAVGAVSPPGGDLSEPVSQATMRIVKVFWALDSSLPIAVTSPPSTGSTRIRSIWTLCARGTASIWDMSSFENREWAMAMLQEESNLNEIVQLVGKDSLSAKDQITLEVARMIREDFCSRTPLPTTTPIPNTTVRRACWRSSASMTRNA